MREQDSLNGGGIVEYFAIKSGMEQTLETLAAAGRKLLDPSSHPVDEYKNFTRWSDAVAEWLDKAGPGTGLSAAWSALPISLLVSGGGYHDDDRSWAYHIVAVRERLKWLATVPTQLAAKGTTVAVPPRTISAQKKSPTGRRVFLVHGRQVDAREMSARFLEKLGLECVILHEQPNKGRTIIEKFEDYSDVAFALVLLTPDDVGGLFDAPPSEQKARARQNVILELGFFLGALGRSKVCALYCDGVELPSDYSGVAFVRLDPDGAWRSLLVRELKAAGLDVDANLAI